MTKQTPPEKLAKIRILYQGECQKLTARGKGLLGYELAINDSTNDSYIRISSNEQGGTCSFEWIKISTLEELIKNRQEGGKPFSAKLFQKAFVSRSANNHGYLAAVLKTEKVIVSSAESPTLLSELSFAAIKDKLSALAGDGVSLTDHVAIALKEKEARKQKKTVEAVTKEPPTGKESKVVKKSKKEADG